MIEGPILFSAPMVRAILNGTKTQTRRLMKQQPEAMAPQHMADGLRHAGWPLEQYSWVEGEDGQCVMYLNCRYGKQGDLLWVRETFAFIDNSEFGVESYYQYRADTDGKCLPGSWPDDAHGDPECPRWKPSIHMPRAASRITLEITRTRPERLQNITEEDAKAEGCDARVCGQDGDGPLRSHRTGFVYVWRDIHGAESWASNPYVWVIEFRRIKP